MDEFLFYIKNVDFIQANKCDFPHLPLFQTLEHCGLPGAPSLVVVVVLLPPPMPAESGATDLFWSSGAGDGTWPFGAGEGTFELKELEELKLGLCQLYV